MYLLSIQLNSFLWKGVGLGNYNSLAFKENKIVLSGVYEIISNNLSLIFQCDCIFLQPGIINQMLAKEVQLIAWYIFKSSTHYTRPHDTPSMQYTTGHIVCVGKLTFISQYLFNICFLTLWTLYCYACRGALIYSIMPTWLYV